MFPFCSNYFCTSFSATPMLVFWVENWIFCFKGLELINIQNCNLLINE